LRYEKSGMSPAPKAATRGRKSARKKVIINRDVESFEIIVVVMCGIRLQRLLMTIEMPRPSPDFLFPENL
jgi:hypothetical protein